MNIDPKWVALRSVEIHRAFSNSGSGQLAFLDIPNIMRIGQITRLANMLRKRGTVTYDSTKALGALLARALWLCQSLNFGCSIVLFRGYFDVAWKKAEDFEEDF